MIVQLNRQTGAHTFSATAIDLPINPAGLRSTRGPLPVVAVFGHPGRVAGLDHHLPAVWTVRRPADLADVRPGELVLFAGATVQDVVSARSILPARTIVVAQVDDSAPGEVVAGVLTAGADVCVRGGQQAILASHLVACRRRQLAQRWVRLDAQRPA